MGVVEKPPVPLQTQLLKVWAYVQNADGTFSPAPTSSGGSTGNVNITGINGSAPALTNPLPVELSDGTNPFGTSSNPLNVTLHAETTKVIGTVNQGTSPWVVSNGGTFAVQATQNGNWTDRIVGNIGGILDGVLGAAKPASAVQVGGNDGTNIFALPLASGGGSLVVSGTVTATSASNGTTGSAVPASASYDGLNVAGTLRGITGVNPSGTIYAQQIDIASILGVTAVAAAAGVLKVGVVGNAGAAFDGAPAAAIPANAVMVGGSDGTNLRALSTDSNGNLNVNSFVQPTSLPAIVQSIFSNGAGGVSALTFPSPNTLGNLLLASSRQNITPTDTNGNVWFQVAGSTTMWYAFNCKAGANTVNFGALVQVQIAEFSGMALASPVDAASLTNSATGVLALNSITTTSNDDLCVYGLGNSTTNGPTYSTTGYTPVGGAQNINAQMFYKVKATAGVEAPSAGQAGVSMNAIPFIAFKALVSSTVTQGLGLTTPSGAWVVTPSLPTDGTPNNNVFQRMPNIWRGNQFSSAGAATIWQPQTGKKARLMRYRVQVGEDSTISGGPLPINVSFSEQLGAVSAATLAFPGFGFTERVVIPASVLATSGVLYDSEWTDLGNGQILTSASAPLIAGIRIPQSTSAVNPSWTIASNQWEAATIGFKTASNAGIFKLVQQTNAVATAASVALPAISVAPGNSLFVFVRTTNAAGGAPTVTVTDTATNSWTTSALTTNASDATHGSSICVGYSTNIKGNAANIITVTTTTNVSSQIEVIAIEYNSAAAGIDAALVGTTGSSTTPASGNYTPATAGDLIFSFFGTAASITTQPTVGSNFTPRGTIFNATQGCLCVADNFGNGALTAGVVNIQTAGTEE